MRRVIGIAVFAISRRGDIIITEKMEKNNRMIRKGE